MLCQQPKDMACQVDIMVKFTMVVMIIIQYAGQSTLSPVLVLGMHPVTEGVGSL
jgi:hypothetical protein